MPHGEIKKRIADLKSELGRVPSETTPFEEMLEHAREGIEHYTPEALQEFLHALRREAKAFEVEHPRIADLVNQVATALSNLGI